MSAAGRKVPTNKHTRILTITHTLTQSNAHSHTQTYTHTHVNKQMSIKK